MADMIIEKFNSKCSFCGTEQFMVVALLDSNDDKKSAIMQYYCFKCNKEMTSKNILWPEYTGAEGR